MAGECFYRVLELPRYSSTGDIRMAYKRLAMEFHPDRGTSANEARFKLVSAAYTHLSDPDLKDRYDASFSRSFSHVDLSAAPFKRRSQSEVVPVRVYEVVSEGSSLRQGLVNRYGNRWQSGSFAKPVSEPFRPPTPTVGLAQSRLWRTESPSVMRAESYTSATRVRQSGVTPAGPARGRTGEIRRSDSAQPRRLFQESPSLNPSLNPPRCQQPPSPVRRFGSPARFESRSSGLRRRPTKRRDPSVTGPLPTRQAQSSGVNMVPRRPSHDTPRTPVDVPRAAQSSGVNTVPRRLSHETPRTPVEVPRAAAVPKVARQRFPSRRVTHSRRESAQAVRRPFV
eukprot:Hpha_TRINITY_DN15391_c4_g3::TRINITY_DN15391_c4_g3_i1::g.90876::m.90876